MPHNENRRLKGGFKSRERNEQVLLSLCRFGLIEGLDNKAEQSYDQQSERNRSTTSLLIKIQSVFFSSVFNAGKVKFKCLN